MVKSLTNLKRSVIERLQKYSKPRKIQRILLENFTRYMYVLMHRQCGKTHFIRCVGLDFLEANFFDDYEPAIGIFASKLKQTLKLYRSRFETILESKNYKPRYDAEETALKYRRYDYKKSRIDFYSASFNPDTDRGGTYPFIALDEYGAYKPHFANSVVGPMGDVYSAPMFITGTPLGPNHFKKEYEYAERKMREGDKDFFAIRWTLDDSLREGEITQRYYDAIQKRYPPDQQHIFRAEYLLDWYAYVPNQIFGYEVADCYSEGRVGFFPCIPQVPVDTFWDIGVNGTAVCLLYTSPSPRD